MGAHLRGPEDSWRFARRLQEQWIDRPFSPVALLLAGCQPSASAAPSTTPEVVIAPTSVSRSSEASPGNRVTPALLGRPGEVWGAESGVDRLVVIRYAPE